MRITFYNIKALIFQLSKNICTNTTFGLNPK